MFFSLPVSLSLSPYLLKRRRNIKFKLGSAARLALDASKWGIALCLSIFMFIKKYPMKNIIF